MDHPSSRNAISYRAGVEDVGIVRSDVACWPSMESLGLMRFTIEIMKERLVASGSFPLTLAFTNCLRVPCIASRSPTPNVSAIAELGIGMIDGISA